MDQEHFWILIGVLTAALAAAVYFAARTTERKNPPIGKFLDVSGKAALY